MSMKDENFRDSSQGDDDVSSHQSDNGVYLVDVGGVNKKGQIFGLSSEAGKFRPSSPIDGISRSEFEQLRALVFHLFDENKILKEQLQTLEEESRLDREQWCQFMQRFSLSHPFGPV